MVSPLESLKNGLSAQPRPRTEIIDVSFTDTSEKDATSIVNTVLDQYLGYVGTAAHEEELRLYRQLTDEYNKLASEIATQEDIRAGYCRMLLTDNPPELISNKRIRLEEAQARLNALRIRIQLLAAQMKETGGTTDGNSPVGPLERQPRYHEDAEWRKLDLDARMAQHQIDKSVLTPNYPDRARLTKDLEFTKELRQLREQQLDEQWNDHMKDRAGRGESPVPVEQQLARAKEEEQLLQGDLKEQQEEFGKLFECARSLEKVGLELQHKRELFHAVRLRLDQKNMERGVPGAIEMLARADCPSQPAHDHRIVFTAGATLWGLCVAASTAVLTRRRNNVPDRSDGAR